MGAGGGLLINNNPGGLIPKGCVYSIPQHCGLERRGRKTSQTVSDKEIQSSVSCELACKWPIWRCGTPAYKHPRGLRGAFVVVTFVAGNSAPQSFQNRVLRFTDLAVLQPNPLEPDAGWGRPHLSKSRCTKGAAVDRQIRGALRVRVC